MNNMADKRCRWRKWERYIRHLKLVPLGRHALTGGLKRYARQRMLFHNRKVDRQNEEIFAVIESLTGLTKDDLTRRSNVEVRDDEATE